MGQAREMGHQERALQRQRPLADSDPAAVRRLQEKWRRQRLRGGRSECVADAPARSTLPTLTLLSGYADIFQPLFEVTADPTSHPELHILLQRVVGFDSVDDESKAERRIYRKFPVPKDWNTTQNRRSLSPRHDLWMLIADVFDHATAPYAYWLYFLYANMTSLNNWRHERGFSMFHFCRPPPHHYFLLTTKLYQTRSGCDRMREKLATPTTSLPPSLLPIRSRTASFSARSRHCNTSSTSSRSA